MISYICIFGLTGSEWCSLSG